jgi:hypothetical protein
MAPRRIPLVLEVDFESQETHRKNTNSEGSSRSDLPNGGRKPHVGSSAHPRRTPHARLRCFRKNDLSLDDGFFLISHDRRRILHFNVTKHPTTQWIIQQLREAFPFDSAPRFLIFDRDAKYGLEVPVTIRFFSIRPV